jgi:hypothetical protein
MRSSAERVRQTGCCVLRYKSASEFHRSRASFRGRQLRRPYFATKPTIVRPGRVAVTAVGEIEYLDVFGDRHLTQFRFRCNGQGYPLGMFKADGEGNEANWYWIGVLGIGQRSLDQRAIQGFR